MGWVPLTELQTEGCSLSISGVLAGARPGALQSKRGDQRASWNPSTFGTHICPSTTCRFSMAV